MDKSLSHRLLGASLHCLLPCASMGPQNVGTPASATSRPLRHRIKRRVGCLPTVFGSSDSFRKLAQIPSASRPVLRGASKSGPGRPAGFESVRLDQPRGPARLRLQQRSTARRGPEAAHGHQGTTCAGPKGHSASVEVGHSASVDVASHGPHRRGRAEPLSLDGAPLDKGTSG